MSDPEQKPDAPKAKRKAPSQATQLARLVVNTGVELFHDAEGSPYATVAPGVTLSLRAKGFQQWLARAYYNDTRDAASASTLADAINLLSASAQFSGPERDVFIRLAPQPDAIWLDLGGQAVRLTADGWTLEPVPAVRFLRPRGMTPLPVPVPTPATQLGPLLSTLVNIRAEDLPLAMGWLLGAMRSRAPFPVLIIVGEQGTAKSYGSQVLRSIIDPNIAPLRSTPKEPRDLMIAASNSFIAAFDNLSSIPEWFSDDLCRLATGAGFATRELHTDTDEIIFRAARPVLFNSITDVARRPDLLDRSMVVALDPIPGASRRTERDLNARFREAHPRLLGALLDASVVALRHEATTTLPLLPRMADFATWVEAGGPAFGWEPGTFLALYEERRRSATAELMSGDLVVEALREMSLPWTGTPTSLFRLLTTQERQRAKDWPPTANAMSARLKRLAAPLREHGLAITRGRTADRRVLTITETGDPQPQILPEY